MTRRHVIAVGVGLASIFVALSPPLWIRWTGEEIALAIRPVDPQSLFRGNYVDLAYDLTVDVPAALDTGDVFYVVLGGGRPATVVRTQIDKPDLGDGETCIRAKVSFANNYAFPELEQYFVTPEQGADLEQRLDELVGVVKTTGSCRAVLVNLERQ